LFGHDVNAIKTPEVKNLTDPSEDTMKKAVVAACGFVLLVCASSAQGPGFSHWTGAQLRGFEKTLGQKAGASKSASQPLADLGTHTIQVSYREASGEAEIHENVTDIFVVQAGEATLAVGGTLVNGKTTAPGERRGASLAGAQHQELGAGDVVNIPAGTPHQVLIKDGQKYTCLVVKVRSRPGA
jgi:mannose-6-phosphate isomerase-like protein (cupin superfamily)